LNKKPLSGTRIATNITTADTEVLDGFGLIDRYRIVRETRDGRMQEIEVKLSDWVFNAINAREVLTLSRNYFRLRKPLERRLYEIARKLRVSVSPGQRLRKVPDRHFSKSRTAISVSPGQFWAV